jgi:uncharacterized Zn finger protein
MAVTLFAIAKLFADEPKVVQRGENAIASGHMLSFTFDSRHIVCKVFASQKDKTYDVEVSQLRHMA